MAMQVYVHAVNQTKIRTPIQDPSLAISLVKLTPGSEAYPMNQRHIFFNGQCLPDDERTFADYGIQDQSELLLVLLHSRDSPLAQEQETEALGWAAAEGYLSVIQWLVEEGGVSAEARNNKGDTPLAQAVSHGQVDIARWLVKEGGVSAETRNNKGETPFAKAVSRGEFDAAKWLAEECRVETETGDNWGVTPLMKAVSFGNLDIARWLVEECKVSVKGENLEGDTVLTLAVRKGHFEFVRWLVEERGVSVAELNDNKESALNVAIRNDRLDIVRWLVLEIGVPMEEENDKESTLIFAIRHDLLDIVRCLVEESRENAKKRDKDGFTPLLNGVFFNSPHVVHWLLSEGHSSVDDDQDFDNGKSVWNPGFNVVGDELIRLLLMFGAPPDGIDVLPPSQQELARQAVVLRARLPRWTKQRNEGMLQNLGTVLPRALGQLVLQLYGPPSPEEVWDKNTGVPLQDLYDEFIRVNDDNRRLREKNARLEDLLAKAKRTAEREDEGTNKRANEGTNEGTSKKARRAEPGKERGTPAP